MYKGVEKAIAGNRVGDIAYAVQEHTEKKYGYGVVRELVGHGLGKELHEDPQVPNFGKRGTGLKMKEGLNCHRTAVKKMCITILMADSKN